MLTIALALNIFQPYILGILGQWKLSCSINPFGFGPCTFIIKDKKGSDLLQKILTLAHG